MKRFLMFKVNTYDTAKCNLFNINHDIIMKVLIDPILIIFKILVFELSSWALLLCYLCNIE